MAMSSQFSESSDADLILKTTAPDDETVDFYVHKCILSAASPFFKQMLTLPQTPCVGTSTPVVEVTEPPSTLGLLLQFLYPISDPFIETLDELTTLLCTAVKYDMTSALDKLRILLISPRFVQDAPIRVYAIACRFDLEEEAKVASRYTLSVNVLDGPLHDDLKYITAYSYHRLLNLHRQRARAAQELLQTLPDEVKCMQCNGARHNLYCPPRWWLDFRERARAELSVRPMTETVFSMSFLARSAQAGCERCGGSILDAHWFFEDLKKKIDALPSTI